MYKIISIIFITVLLILFGFILITKNSPKPKTTTWNFQSIDTMKYSRDLAREKLGSKSYEDLINKQTQQIADTGATHIAIATPYDEEFYPVLKLWVDSARENNLKVWFRGNWSGWEGWFEYPKITRDQHEAKTKEFIEKHPDLFENGDIFTACPECENGGPGDPRQTGDIIGYRKFLVSEYKTTKSSFKMINKSVTTNYNSMNGDVASAVMDRETTKSLGGVVTIDHYVGTSNQLVEDIRALSISSGGKVVLGEFGAPIPDIHGKMTEEEQAKWINDALTKLSTMPEVIGVNYWTNMGSTTALWNENGSPRKAVSVLKNTFRIIKPQ